MTNKNDLRKHAKQIRSSLDIKTISEKIVEQIMNFEPYKKAKNIMLFYPIDNEVDLRKLFEDKSKNFYLPKVDGEQMKVCPFKESDEFELSKFKTKEPRTEPINDLEILDIIFVPALMADRKNNRLGYGGGFYDRFLSKLPQNIIKIVPIPSDLIIDEIPIDIFDELVDVTICENYILK